MYTMNEANKYEPVCVMHIFLKRILLFIQFLEDTISYVVSSSAGEQHVCSIFISFQRAELGDECCQSAELGTEGVGFCQMIM